MRHEFVASCNLNLPLQSVRRYDSSIAYFPDTVHDFHWLFSKLTLSISNTFRRLSLYKSTNINITTVQAFHGTYSSDIGDIAHCSLHINEMAVSERLQKTFFWQVLRYVAVLEYFMNSHVLLSKFKKSVHAVRKQTWIGICECAFWLERYHTQNKIAA